VRPTRVLINNPATGVEWIDQPSSRPFTPSTVTWQWSWP